MKKRKLGLAMVMHIFKPSTPPVAEAADLSEFEVSLVYKAISRTARTVIQRNPVSKNQKKKKKRRKLLRKSAPIVRKLATVPTQSISASF